MNKSTSAQASATLLPGFSDPTHGAGDAFRTLLEATAYPTRICSLGADLQGMGGVDVAVLAALLTLADADTPVCLIGEINPALGDYLRFHCGCPIVREPSAAAFGFIADAGLACRAFEFPMGTDEYPDRSATVIIQVHSLSDGPQRTFRGPGIESTGKLSPTVPDQFWSAWRENNDAYPRGIDVIFVCGDHFAALPRSSRIEV